MCFGDFEGNNLLLNMYDLKCLLDFRRKNQVGIWILTQNLGGVCYRLKLGECITLEALLK